MKRYKHTLSHYRMLTGNMGEFIPISCVPVLPGDTFQAHSSVVIRVTPLNTPVMHPVTVRVHHFFVPNRIIYDDWEDFITGGPQGTSAPTIPQAVKTTDKNDLPANLGIPPINGLNFNELSLRGANAIFNEFYRDQDLVTERLEDDMTTPRISWEKDYFTTARPWSQKGPSVSLPIGTSADVHTAAASGADVEVYSDAQSEFRRLYTPAANPDYLALDTLAGAASGNKLYADLSGAASPEVNDWRAAFALQRYQEARARYGSRFTEYLRYLGVQPSDSRLQRPELLGGGQSRINFSEVLQTAGTTDGSGDGVGDLYGHGIAGVRTNRYRKFFEEHGYCYTILSVRPKAIYMNGLHREYNKSTKEDFYQKELVNLGQQEIYDTELYGNNSNVVFGYQDRYQEYRGHPSQVSGDFRDTLDAWTMARKLAAGPTLNASFVECNPDDRIFQVSTSVADSLWIMANNHIVARRLVPKRANPRII